MRSTAFAILLVQLIATQTAEACILRHRQRCSSVPLPTSPAIQRQITPDQTPRPRELWRIDRDDITRITIQSSSSPWQVMSEPFHLEQIDRSWKIRGPFKADVPTKNIESLIDELAVLKCDEFVADNVRDLAKFGIDNPNFKLEFKITVEVKNAKPRVLEIGNQVYLLEGGRYARIDDSRTVFVLNQEFVKKLSKDPFALLDKNLRKLNAADVLAPEAAREALIRFVKANPKANEAPASEDNLRKANISIEKDGTFTIHSIHVDPNKKVYSRVVVTGHGPGQPGGVIIRCTGSFKRDEKGTWAVVDAKFSYTCVLAPPQPPSK